MIFTDNYQKLLILQSHDISRYMTAETFTLEPEHFLPKNILKYRHLLSSGKRALKQNIINLGRLKTFL